MDMGFLALVARKAAVIRRLRGAVSYQRGGRCTEGDHGGAVRAVHAGAGRAGDCCGAWTRREARRRSHSYLLAPQGLSLRLPTLIEAKLETVFKALMTLPVVLPPSSLEESLIRLEPR